MVDRSLPEPSYVAEVVSMVVLTLFLVADVVTKIDPYIVLAVAIVLLLVFVIALSDRQKKTNALRIALHNADVEAEKHRLWMQQTGALTSDSTRTHARLEGIMLVETMVEEVLREPGLKGSRKSAYDDMLKRIRDVERGASPFPTGSIPFPIRQQMEQARQAQPPKETP